MAASRDQTAGLRADTARLRRENVELRRVVGLLRQLGLNSSKSRKPPATDEPAKPPPMQRTPRHRAAQRKPAGWAAATRGQNAARKSPDHIDHPGATANPNCSTVRALASQPRAARVRLPTQPTRPRPAPATNPMPRRLHETVRTKATSLPKASWRNIVIGLLFSMWPAVCPPEAHGQFQDVSAKSGLTAKLVSGSADKPYILESMAGGVAFLDYDGDGWLDVYLVNGGTLESLAGRAPAPSNHLYRNNRDGTFTDVTEACGVGDSGWGMGVAVADVDNNGFEDLYVTNYGPNRLYLNQGGCKFKERSRESGVDGNEWSSSAAFADFDSDGDVDLYVTNYLEFDPGNLPQDSLLCRYRGIRVQCGPRGMVPTADRLYENFGEGRFRDVSGPSGLAALPTPTGWAWLGLTSMTTATQTRTSRTTRRQTFCSGTTGTEHSPKRACWPASRSAWTARNRLVWESTSGTTTTTGGLT